jgi:hypothetical protein
MANLTLEATIEHGRIIVTEPEKLPATGKALVTVLDMPERKPDWKKIEAILGTLKTDIDAAEWERSVRSEWNERERAQGRMKSSSKLLAMTTPSIAPA